MSELRCTCGEQTLCACPVHRMPDELTTKGTGAGEVPTFFAPTLHTVAPPWSHEVVRASDFDSYRERAEAEIEKQKSGWGEAFRLAVFHQKRADKAEAALSAALARADAAEKFLIEAEALLCDPNGGSAANELARRIQAVLTAKAAPTKGAN